MPLLKKLSAFTLVETMAAMLLVSISFAAMYGLFSRILNDNFVAGKLKLEIKLNRLLTERDMKKNYSTGLVRLDNIMVVSKRIDYSSTIFCYQITAFDANSKELYQVRKLVLRDENKSLYDN